MPYHVHPHKSVHWICPELVEYHSRCKRMDAALKDRRVGWLVSTEFVELVKIFLQREPLRPLEKPFFSHTTLFRDRQVGTRIVGGYWRIIITMGTVNLRMQIKRFGKPLSCGLSVASDNKNVRHLLIVGN